MPSETDDEAAYAETVAAWLRIAIPAECRPGVAANLAILRRHLGVVEQAAIGAPPDPAELLRP